MSSRNSRTASGGVQSLSNAANTFAMSAKSIQKMKNLKTVVMNIIIKSVLIIGVAVILIDRLASDSFIGREVIIGAALVAIGWTIASYSRGQWEDHLVTFIIIIVAAGIYYGSWWNFENILGLNINNPLTMGYFVILSFFTLIVLVSRFTYMNIVKVAGWAIGLSVLGIFAFTSSVWGTLNVCEFDESVGGIQDPFEIVIVVYVTWVILIGLMFYLETKNPKGITSWGQTQYIIFGVCVVITMYFLGYTWERCAPAFKKMEGESEKQAEETAIKDEPSWIDNSAHIATIVAWFNLFIGHYISSAFFAFVGYSILDQCAPKNDPRVMSVNLLSLIYLLVGMIYGFRKITGH